MCGSAPCCSSSPSPACLSKEGRTRFNKPPTAAAMVTYKRPQYKSIIQLESDTTRRQQVTNLQCEGVHLFTNGDELWIVIIQTIPYPNISISSAGHKEPEKKNCYSLIWGHEMDHGWGEGSESGGGNWQVWTFCQFSHYVVIWKANSKIIVQYIVTWCVFPQTATD